MREYDLVAIIDPEVDEEGISEITDKISKFISDRGGVVDRVDNWGKRRLAYPVKKFMEGNYMSTRFKLEVGLIKEFEAEVRALGNVLRYLVVKV